MDPAPDRSTPPIPHAPRGNFEIFATFLKLGLTSFGGPIAHIAYFRQELVLRRSWITEAGYADIVALCQLLPGPTSSQVGFAIGLNQAGWLGGLGAFVGFTLPSALIMFAAAGGLPLLRDELGSSLIHGLMLVAVVIVAQAVFGMARSNWKTPAAALIGLGALAVALTASSPLAQPIVILAGGVIGLLTFPTKDTPPVQQRLRATASTLGPLIVFVILLVSLPLLAGAGGGLMSVADTFYRSGAFVFGGGHVVLPLLEVETVGRGWVDEQSFLAGYALAQAVPGPLFTFAGYLGAVSNTGVMPMAAGVLALVMIFLPGLLLVAGTMPFWTHLKALPAASAFAAGASASVVGILAAALWDPVIRSAVLSPADVFVATLGFILLQGFRAPPLVLIPLIMLAAVGVGSAN